MAAQGTGLPTIDRGGISAVPDTSSFGAAERATASGIIDAVAGLGRLQKQVLSPLLVEQGRKDASKAVQEGRFEDERSRITEYGEAYDDVLTSGALASFATTDEKQLDDFLADDPYDPDAFQTRTEAYRSAVLKGTPGRLAVQRAATFDRRRDETLGNMRLARARADTAEAGANIVSRKDELVARIARNAEASAAYVEADPQFAGDVDELTSLWTQIAANPVLGVSPEEAERNRQTDADKFQAAAIAGHVRSVFRNQGPDAALAEIQALLPPTGGDIELEPTDDRQGLPTLGLTDGARTIAYDRAIAAYNEENGLSQQRANIASSQRTQASQRVEDLITAMRYGGEVDFDELRSTAEASGDPGLVARARWAIEVGVQPPEGFGGGGTGGSFNGDATVSGSFQASVDFVIDQIEGGDTYLPDDNGRGPTRFGINATANPDLDIANLTRDGAVRRYRRDYWDAIGADQLPPALALVAFDAAVNHGPGDARRWIAESGGDVGQYLALREADYRAIAASSREQAGNLPGWLNRLQNVRQRAARVQSFQNNQDGFSTDPISFALGNANRPALASVTPLPVDAVFSPTTQGAWGQLLQSRRATGRTLAAQYQVPARMLTDGEAQAYKDRFERDPVSAITFAQVATAAVGGQGARDLLAEVGQGGAAPTIIHIADLSRPGGDGRFAAQAAQGLSYKAEGQSLEAEDRGAVVDAVNRYRASFRSSPALLSAIQNTAEAAALADRATGRLQEPDYYAQASMGRTSWQGRAYGGGAAINGASVVVPRWLNPEYFDDALEALAEGWAPQGIGPVYANGQPIPARRVARLNPVLMPDGRYRLVDDRGNVALTRDGSPYDVNLDAGRDFVRRRLGANAVRPD